jgi:hypothetical protein
MLFYVFHYFAEDGRIEGRLLLRISRMNVKKTGACIPAPFDILSYFPGSNGQVCVHLPGWYITGRSDGDN